ncbi:hypothetical protein [Flavobacterium gawalongense]|uniref:Uncharacterized protein n=1 Tax=Flavobacterium gawalongense TaxID=2594432 RepID=A0A553B916_9FLAO|nr:hypothetical protein [Flavobacterium gawalongense]TRW96160.1 hypothetical protein FNW33_17300 [Flavobacterium gawalongense]TRX00932.1 hypothetical protein FNW12_17390 [Flavobacterium gawalongense]TRX04721.1 hypothetical protein FNW11_17260 [Flavobacterium gawalongense]TRX05726.1 hypothetical protein FNW10_16925 [Flavobacterium gawalongense]TRX21014.1 hypothetical protein FNW38_17330 [Flavobacterium gawalongense]
MKTEITFLLPAFFTIVGTIYFLFDAPKYWTGLVQTILLQSQKNRPIYQFTVPLRATSGNFDSSPPKVESLIKTIRPSIRTTILNVNFTIYNRIIF